MPYLELKSVSKGYGVNGSRSEVLRDINFTVEKGEFVAIVGYSGAGKTTLISLIAGLLRPDTGTATLNDLEITAPGPDRGIVFQNYSLLPWLTVFENILLAVDQVFPNYSPEKKRQHAEQFIAMVNLTPAREKRPSELSGGMKQRVSVARALAMDPQILLLDEPLSALDALTRATLQDEISRIWSESRKTVVLITNDVDEGIYLADRIIPLSAGPGATLGPSFTVDIPRPRDRKELNHEPRFKRLRREVMEWLIASNKKKAVTLTKNLVLPDIMPEDLSVPRQLGGRTKPIRRSEIKAEVVEMN
ncbi:MAG: nitrate ABC transporter ATP-binding protein [Limisphaerales bacterium]|nr:MAG: nitrate ABC transporter ATP-binding protein [Limisphaerales bacterium]KAG0508048.1 MAG: nitrate ABC transporter ATP-binding protein [Limisphaerales bacterium]TXT52053.1 MAG: nitrate ABC transporter ATP-binding protein [Limisphaerales bacterium]